MKMKNSVMLLTIISCSLFVPQTIAASASSVATWQAAATKNTEAELVVTPLGSLAFQYAAGTNSFNTVNGLFDVVIRGDHAASSSFIFSAQKLSGQLRHLTLDQTIDVAIYWNGEKINEATPVNLIDTNGDKMGGNLSNMAANYKTSSGGPDVYAQDFFTFELENPMENAMPLAGMDKLTDGVFSGTVSVQFDAFWS